MILQIGGMREGDYLVAIGERDVKWSSHSEVVTMIRDAENTLKLRLVTPLDRSLVKLGAKSGSDKAKAIKVHSSLSSPSSTTSSSSGLSMSAGPASSEETFSPSSSESGVTLDEEFCGSVRSSRSANDSLFVRLVRVCLVV